MSRKVTATVNLNALAHNLLQVKALAPNAKVLGMVKANGYGHGSLAVAHTLESNHCDALGVAHLSEAQFLRSKGISAPLVALSGILNKYELQQHLILKIDVVIHQEWQIALLESMRITRPIRVWLKINTGMNRLGIPLNQAELFYQRIRAINNINSVVLMTHCATADEVDTQFFTEQLQQFDTLAHLQQHEHTHFSFANSAGIIAKSPELMDWIRPGIMLYGSSPFTVNPNQTAQDLNLQAVMNLTAKVIAINPVKKGDTVGYGRRWQAQNDSIIATVGIGYGDGYPRHAKNGTAAIINGHRATLAGRISMDLSSFDITGCAEHIHIGDSVELWGANNPIDEVAKYSDTISYELMCRLTNRVSFIYHD